MDYKLQKLSNGLNILTVPMIESESVAITVWVKTGSRKEEKEKLGISHFLEHMSLKGSKKYPTMQILFENFDSLGAEHNAGTSKEWTNFWVKLAKYDVERGFDILSDVVLNPILDWEEAKRERNVIFQEMKMIKDTPMRYIGDIFEELIYSDSSLGWDIIGTESSMNNIKRDDFIDYRKKHYFAGNMLVAVSGGINEEKIVSLTKKYFGGLKNSIGSELSEFKGNQKGSKIRILNKKTDQAHIILGFLTEGRKYKAKFAQAVLSTILGGGASSRLFNEVRIKRGLAYAINGSVDRYTDIGYFGVYAGTGIEKSTEAIKVILDECYKLTNRKSPVTDYELSKVKGYLKGHLALQFEDSSFVNDFFSEQALFDDKILTPKDLFKKIDEVTIEEVYTEAKKIFNPTKLNLAVIGPYKSDAEFKKII